MELPDSSRHDKAAQYSSKSETSPLLSGSFANSIGGSQRLRNPSTYANSSLGMPRDARLSLPMPIVNLNAKYDPSQFPMVLTKRIVTYALLLLVLAVGVMLHVCIPIDAGDQFCNRVGFDRNNSVTIASTATATATASISTMFSTASTDVTIATSAATNMPTWPSSAFASSTSSLAN